MLCIPVMRSSPSRTVYEFMPTQTGLIGTSEMNQAHTALWLTFIHENPSHHRTSETWARSALWPGRETSTPSPGVNLSSKSAEGRNRRYCSAEVPKSREISSTGSPHLVALNSTIVPRCPSTSMAPAPACRAPHYVCQRHSRTSIIIPARIR